MVGSKKGKTFRKKIISLIVVLFLVGGLFLSATMGFFDFLWGKGKTASLPGEDEYILGLKKQAELLEKTLQKTPHDGEGQAHLGHTYYELAMYCWSQGLQEKDIYAEKSRQYLLQAAKGGLQEPLVTLQIALLAAFLQNDEPSAEKYFQDTLALQDDYPEAHFYYGVFLLSQGKKEKAREHWERTLQLVDQNSPLAAEVQRYLILSDETDVSGQSG